MRAPDYARYCVLDRAFFEDPGHAPDARDRFPPADAELPIGWRRHESGIWVQCLPADKLLPEQGWKIHVSAAYGEYDETVGMVAEYCFANDVHFKFLRGPATAAQQNAKYASRGSSGKLLTVYPVDEAELAAILDGLGEMLKGRRGPYILSDLRWQEGPLYLRYGSFVRLTCLDEKENRVAALRSPDGALAPDRRRPGFELPAWVTPPPFVARQIEAADQDDDPDAFPFDVERSLHYSNGGGVYLATDRRDGQTVILREARPYAGVDPDGRDAVDRLRDEERVLAKLAGCDFVPEVYEHLEVWEHHFLVEEYVSGTPMHRWLFGEGEDEGNYPLAHEDPTDEELAAHVERALGHARELERIVRTLHTRGVVFGDVHPSNIIVRPDDRLCLVDFEFSYDLSEKPAHAGRGGAAGYVHAKARVGTAPDIYGLACVWLFLFLPLTQLAALNGGKIRQLADAAAAQFPALPSDYAAHVVDLFEEALGEQVPKAFQPALPGPGDSDGWRRVTDDLAELILESATPDRADRLYPGDPRQFQTGGIDLAHGAAGVLWALAECGYDVPDQHVEWLEKAVAQAHDPQPGLWSGLHGTALAFDRLGHDAQARTVFAAAQERALVQDERGQTTAGYADGLAGMGLTQLHFGRAWGEDSLIEQARTTGERLALVLDPALCARPGLTPPAPVSRGGLFNGPAGMAVYFVELFELSGEQRWLDLAELALAREATQAQVRDGGLYYRRTSRISLYLETGSAGIGYAMRALARHRPSDELARDLAMIDRASAAPFVVLPGLLDGRAGLISALADTGVDNRIRVTRHMERLGWQLLPYRGRLAVPGRQLLRLSMDLGTGAAGVLLAVTAASTERGALPLLDSRRPRGHAGLPHTRNEKGGAAP
ncbi:class III lanthionine synthetase LanKC [Actinospica sp.]|uniref:class III lanthionine synthetase LanKC n=1 Tax=Actinospica sp. TaxID=1872142 RepID=UPI002C722A16|nr:class III lanthionine synthetase LanKC [Actinospica sp.]HWG23000.1 class III lanthionine synthetase LanKC [Actinospica sp.]